MSSLSPLDQLAVDAFAIALQTCREAEIELPETVWALEKELDQHVSELKAIAQQHPQLNAAYRTARNVLRREAGDRNKLLLAPTLPTRPTPLTNNPTPAVTEADAAAETSPKTKPEPEQSLPVSTKKAPRTTTFWENFDRIAIMAAGGAFLGGAVVQILGGGASQLIGAMLGAIAGTLAGFYARSGKTGPSRHS